MRAVVYARVSTEHEAQINALENQLEWYKIEASRHSDWEITEVYVDQGITGTQAQKRPESLRMMEDARKGKFDLIITREVSRFARNTVDALSYTRELKAMGVNVFFINDGINTATNDGELRLTIMSSMAQDESRKISERVKAGQKISREKHVLYGSGNILGYRRENGTYIPDPDQAETVRLIFQMYSDGEKGLTKIVNELYRLGRLDAGGHVSWDASKVSRVLHNATYKGCICYNKSHSDGYLTQKRVKNLDESSYVYVKGDFEPLVSEEMWDRCQQILLARSARVIDENGKKHKYMRNTPKSVWTAKLRCSCGAGFIQFKWRVNRDGAVVHGFQCYRRTRRPSISYLQEHGLDLGISCQIKAISEWKLDLMASKVFQNLTFDKGKTVKEVYRILNRCMAEEKTVRISRKAMLENSIAKQKERLDRYIDLCADGVITKQELMERRKGLDEQIAELQSQYESIEQEDERSGSIDMKLISQKLDEWQKAAKTDVSRELINSCVAQITPVSNEEFRWVLDFQLSEVKGINMTSCTMDGFMELARFVIPFEDAKAFKASRNQKIHRRDWTDLTVVVGIRSKIHPYGSVEWEKLSIFLKLLIGKLPSPAEDDNISGLLEDIDLESYRAVAQDTMRIQLDNENGELNPIPVSRDVGISVPELDPLTQILKEFHDAFGGIDWTDEDKVKKQVADLPAIVSKDEAYQNAIKNSDAQNARVESDRATMQAILDSMSTTIELYKAVNENPALCKWIQDMVFANTYQTSPPAKEDQPDFD